MHILSQCTTELVRTVIVPASGWDPAVDNANDTDDVIGRIGWTPVLRNATGILRNLSSAGPHARDLLRSTEGLADALLRMLRTAAGNNEVDNKVGCRHINILLLTVLWFYFFHALCS